MSRRKSSVAVRTRVAGKCLLILCIWIVAAATPFGYSGDKLKRLPATLSSPHPSLLFEQNLGQTRPEIRFITRGPGFTLLLTPKQAIWVLPAARVDRSSSLPFKPGASTQPIRVIRMCFLGLNSNLQVIGDRVSSARVSYFRGMDPAGWQGHIPTYHRVVYRKIYPGTDLIFHADRGPLEYDFVLSPDADPNRIRFNFEGTDSATIGPDGELELATEAGMIRQIVPHVYQVIGGRRTELSGRYRLYQDGSVGFVVSRYDRTLPLTIDPVLDFSTYLGGSRGDVAGGVAVDSEGNIYIAGSTGSLDFPLLGAVQDQFAGGGTPNGDVFVTKLDPSASSVIYSTYIGGGTTDIARSIAVDSEGRAIVTGTTFSTDFPATPGSFQTNCSGLCPFVTRLSADGSQLSYSTFVGRGDGAAVAVDASGQASITGQTSSSNFPTANAFQPIKGGQADAFVAKLNGVGSSLVFSTFLGGKSDENLTGKQDIATDSAGNIYVVGRTRSSDFPLKNAVQGALQGTEDAFVSKLSPSGSLIYSTFLGGSDEDQGSGISADMQGSAYVTGYTLSSDFPTQNAFQQNFAGGIPFGDAFVTKVAPAGGSLVFSTFLGGQSGDTANDIAVDGQGRAVVVGSAASNFPVLHPLRGFDGVDNYVAKFSADGSKLVYSTPVGGGNQNVTVTTFGTKVIVAGSIPVGTLPIINALQPKTNGDAEAFLAGISDAGTIYFAQFANGVGAISDILLTNSSPTSTSTATLSFRDDNGAPFPVNIVVTDTTSGKSVALETTSEQQVQVPPLGLVRITTDGKGMVTKGSAKVDFDSPLGGVIRFTLNPFGTAGVGESKLVRGFITPVRRSAINTGVAVVNTEDHLVGLTLRLRNRKGEEIPGGLTTTALEAHAQLAKFIDELFPNATLTNFEGTLTVEAGTLNDLIAATALELGSNPGQFTTLPVTPIP